MSQTSSDSDAGFRTNLGLLNGDSDAGVMVSITVLAEDGSIVAHLDNLWLEKAEFKQFNLADRLGINLTEPMRASVVIEPTSGGPIAAYASTVDNRTQDPILIPAIPAMFEETGSTR